MNPLVPHFKLRMLRLEHRRASLRVFPVFKFLFIIESQNVFYLKTLGPWIDQPLLRTAEMIFIVALTAHVRTHFLTCGLLVYVVILNTLTCFQGAHSLDERRTRY